MKALILALLIGTCTISQAKAYYGETFEASGMSKTSAEVSAKIADNKAKEICMNEGAENFSRVGDYRYSYGEGTIECDVQGVCRRRTIYFAVGTYRCYFSW
jgi:hypothetical protein